MCISWRILFHSADQPVGQHRAHHDPGTPGPGVNPFGKSAPVVETGQAEFDLELDDFTKRFRAVFHTVQSLRPADQ